MTNRRSDIEDGDTCPMCNDGEMGEVKAEGECTCHISPPCGFCLTQRLMCDECGYEVTYGN